MNSIDHELGRPGYDERVDAPSSPSVLAEIEALAAQVGESEALSDEPVNAPTASIARSRPVHTAPPHTALPHTPPPQPPLMANEAIVAADPTDAPFDPTIDASAMSTHTASASDLVEIQPTPAGESLVESPDPADPPVDPTVPVDRLVPGDMLPPLAPAPPTPSPLMGSATTPHPSGVLSDAGRLALLDAMPVAVFLIDGSATVRYANQRTAEMIKMDRQEILGRNVLDFVCVEDLDFAAELFNAGSSYSTELMGPSRIRYIDATGRANWTQVWAQFAPPVLGVEGFIITLTNESVRDVLATAVSSVAADDTLDSTLGAIALSARALPLDARGAVLMAESVAVGEPARLRTFGNWPLDESAVNALGTPWRFAIEQREACDIEDVAASGLAPGAREVLGRAGVRSMFVRPIFDMYHEAIGVLVLFRDRVGAASPNHNDHLDEATRLAALAYAQKRRRHELETAALRDALTGVGNRAAFNDRIRTERRAADILFIDLDRFKRVNDTFGHDVGDQVVTMAAGRIEQAIRSSDDVYRTGGDEFVVVCEATGEDPSERIALAERIVDRLVEPFAIGDESITIGATVGIAAAGDRSLTETLRAADRALYAAKERGRAGWAHDGM